MRRFPPVAALFLLALPAMAARQVALVTDGELAQPARHGLAKLQEALRARGLDVTRPPPPGRRARSPWSPGANSRSRPDTDWPNSRKPCAPEASTSPPRPRKPTTRSEERRVGKESRSRRSP